MMSIFSVSFAANQINSLPANLSITNSNDIINFNSSFNDVIVHFYIVHDTSHTYGLISSGFNGYPWYSLPEEYRPFNLVNCTLTAINDPSDGLRWIDKTQPVQFDLKLYKITNFGYSSFIINQSTPDLRISEYQEPSAVGDGYLTNGLPVGNVIYFDLGSSGVEYDVTLRSYFNSYSSFFGIGASWVNDNRKYGFSDSLPTTSTNFDESSGSSLAWSGYGKPTISGRYKEGESNISGTSTGRYLWIVNPLYNSGYYDEPDKGSSLNGNIFYIGGFSVDTPYYSYKLKQSATSLGLSSDVASSVGGVGSVTSSGAINTVVNDGSGDEYVPSVGGDNSPPQEVSASEGIKQTLDQFVQMFLNIFTAPISHIQQLISAGSEFISHLSGMWSWLPNEISGFVISAFVVMVAISIFKLFL